MEIKQYWESRLPKPSAGDLSFFRDKLRRFILDDPDDIAKSPVNVRQYVVRLLDGGVDGMMMDYYVKLRYYLVRNAYYNYVPKTKLMLMSVYELVRTAVIYKVDLYLKHMYKLHIKDAMAGGQEPPRAVTRQPVLDEHARALYPEVMQRWDEMTETIVCIPAPDAANLVLSEDFGMGVLEERARETGTKLWLEDSTPDILKRLYRPLVGTSRPFQAWSVANVVMDLARFWDPIKNRSVETDDAMAVLEVLQRGLNISPAGYAGCFKLLALLFYGCSHESYYIGVFVSALFTRFYYTRCWEGEEAAFDLPAFDLFASNDVIYTWAFLGSLVLLPPERKTKTCFLPMLAGDGTNTSRLRLLQFEPVQEFIVANGYPASTLSKSPLLMITHALETNDYWSTPNMPGRIILEKFLAYAKMNDTA